MAKKGGNNNENNAKNKNTYKKQNAYKNNKKLVTRKGNISDSDVDSEVDSKGNIKGLIDYDYDSDYIYSSDCDYDDDSMDEDSSYNSSKINAKRNKRRPRKAAIKASKIIKKMVKNISDEESEYDFDDSFDSDDESMNDGDIAGVVGEEEVDEENDTQEDDDEVEDEENNDIEEDDEMNVENNKFGGILLTLGGGGGGEVNNMIPKRHDLLKEPEIVKKFVDLVSKPLEDNSIDSQIDQFKKLDDKKQKDLIIALEQRPIISDSGINLMLKILTMLVPPEIKAIALAKYNNLQNLDQSTTEYFKLRNWLDKFTSIPFGIYKELPVKLDDGAEICCKFMENAKKCLDEAVYGQEESKLHIMQFISTKIANPSGNGLSLLLIGKPGIGKTSIIKNGIAKALNWPFQFISLGGDSDASTFTGHQLVYESSHCGKIVNSLISSKSMSTVLMFDEVDKISQTPKGEEIQNMLIHLTDPVQNSEFEDKYLAGIPIDLSKVMFVFSANDISKIDRVLLDRMMVINLKGYDLKQKIVIAENYLLPTILKEVNLTEKIAISREIIQHVIENYSKDEDGVRELKRCLEQIVQKINMLRIYNSPGLPFYIKDFSLPFILKKEHIPLFLKKKENNDRPPPGMYI